MARFRTGILTPENILSFAPGVSEEVFLIIDARQDVQRKTIYGSGLISGSIDVLEDFAGKGAIIKRAYATSRTRDGISLSKGLGFRQILPIDEEDNLLRFELDIEHSSSPLLKRYQRIVKRVSSKDQ